MTTNDNPIVSVIIPNYNHAVFLQQRIDSVLKQTYTEFELIILDDCSTDNSRNVIETYRDVPRVSHIMYNESNSGNPFIQWDKGIKLAKGEYIWIAESDDWCELSLLENLVKGLNEKPDCVVSYCQSYCIDNHNRINFQSNHISLGEYVNGKDFIGRYILKRNPIFNASMAVWRKNVYSKIKKDYINYKLTGDYFFWIELCAYGNVFISGKLLNYFREHEKNVSFNSTKNGLRFMEQIPVLKNLLERKIITPADYLAGLKKLYADFRLQQKNISAENAVAIKRLFTLYSGARYKLDLYVFQRSIQAFSRKLLHI